MTMPDVSSAHAISEKLRSALGQVVKGRDDTIKKIIAAIFADGHVLLEDYPGSGKTTLAKALGKLIAPADASGHILPFRRIQFTPDLLPGDVLGVSVFDSKTSAFRFVHGPVFAHIVLADEINRTGPKVQAAFLECMAEKQVTIDNHTYPLDTFFFVLGTQNPIDMAGTYPLPYVQLDRFLFKIPMPYVDATTELALLHQHDAIMHAAAELSPVTTRDEILAARKLTAQVAVHPSIQKAIINIVQATRGNPQIQYGVSTRAALLLQQAVKALAVIAGRNYATEDDLKEAIPPVLLHRLKFHPSAGNPAEALSRLVEPFLENVIIQG